MMGSGSIRFDSFNRYKKASSAFVHVSLMHKETLIYSPSTVVAVNHHPVRRPSCFRRSHFSPLTHHLSPIICHLSQTSSPITNRERQISSLLILPLLSPCLLSHLKPPYSFLSSVRHGTAQYVPIPYQIGHQPARVTSTVQQTLVARPWLHPNPNHVPKGS